MKRFLLAILLCLGLGAAGAHAAGQPAREQQEQQTAEQFLASLNFQKGKITLPGGIATLELPPGFRYLAPAGVAAKLGFFGKLLALLVAFKKLVILGAVAAASLLWKLFRREKPAPAAPAPAVSLEKDTQP